MTTSANVTELAAARMLPSRGLVAVARGGSTPTKNRAIPSAATPRTQRSRRCTGSRNSQGARTKMQSGLASSRNTALAAVAALALGGCGGAGSRAAHEPAPTRSSDVVTLEELSRVATASTLFEALHALRPAWFRRNPTTLRPQSEGDVVVYVDQSRLGGPEALRTLQVNAAVAIRHYSASEAEARFGPGHLHGAIQVVTSR